MNQPAFQGIDVVYKGKADNKDIRDLLEKLVPKATEQMKEYAQRFKGANEMETSKKIFNFLKNDLSYIADGNEQIIKLPSALLKTKVGDCKSYALFTASVLDNLKIPYIITYTSYNDNPIPHHVYIVTKNGIIIDAVYGIFNKEKKANYKYTKNMNVRYMAGMGDCGCGGKCSGKGMGDVFDDARAKRDQARNYAREKQQQLENYAREQEAKAKAVRDKAIADAKALRDKIEAEAKAVRDKAIELANKIPQGLKTGSLAGGRALFILMIENNLDGFASKLASGNTTNLLNKWYRLGGDRTKLAKALKTGASKPAKKLGFLPKLKAIYTKGGINGIGETNSDIIVNETIKAYKMNPSLQSAIGGLCTGAGTVIGAVIGAAGGLTAAATATIGTVSGGALGLVVIGLTDVIVEAIRKVPESEVAQAETQPLTQPTIDPSTTTDITKLVSKPSSLTSNNTLLYVGGAGLLAGAIYFATKK